MLLFPNAKINIGLQIVAKRPDGFHDLQSCFYPIGWSDMLEVLTAEKTQFRSSGLDIPGDATQNLCLRAYQLMARDWALGPVDIHLHKIVPIGAGLGGGSADGAFAIRAFNDIFEIQLSDNQMENYARQLGSDCAFFIQNQPKYGFGKGDELAPIDLSLKGKHLVLVYPNIHISTAEAYAGVRPQPARCDLREVLRQPVETWREEVKNDFENHLFVKYPNLEKIKNEFYDQGALYASMTGSGSTIFGIFNQALTLPTHWSQWTTWQGPCHF
jgi:4-diphosphocytidyl-2-C-methyl-D-erythritol kinase